MSSWVLQRGVDGCLHILPLDDSAPHTDRAEKCVCRPELNGEGLIVHNAFDKREDYETGRRQVN